MYAIISDSGKQFRVEEGQQFEIDYREVAAGEEIKFETVLAVSGDGTTKLGTPHLSGATVTAKVVGVTQGPKLVVQKLRRRKNSRRKTVHRQMYTTVKIEKISG